jgi:D-alanyl-D-alanine carboxypeptidase (penicillin-binding protein 5/6)
MRKLLAFVLAIFLIVSVATPINAENTINNEAESNDELTDMNLKSAVLMEAGSGKVLYSKNPDGAYAPASVTKVMTLLLAAEALADGKISLNDTVMISKRAAEMGGSQVFLEEGETISVEELFKCTVIASANDAAVALAELVSGSERAFVNAMNQRAMELGLKSTNFENATGLDDTAKNHVTSAYDIAIMSRELIKHEIILNYSSLWQDTIRGGEFTLTNTNRLVRFYDGCNGLKTGSTDKAGYCMSATAKRDGMQLIAVVMGAPTRDERNGIAKELLDYGFANYSVWSQSEAVVETAPIIRGMEDTVTLYSAPFTAVVSSSEAGKIEKKYNLPPTVSAPVKAGEELGCVEYYLGDDMIGKSSVYSKVDIDKIGYFEICLRMLKKMFFKS